MKGLKDLQRTTEAVTYGTLLAVVTIGALLLIMSLRQAPLKYWRH